MMIHEFKEEFRFLSNFWPAPILFEDITYPTAEHLYQALKTTSQMERLSIAELPTPGKAKRAGGKITLRSDWEDVKYEMMLHTVRLKFRQNPLLAKELVNTTGELVEGNYWHDNYWGDCYCEKHFSTKGKNYLGQILMLVRDEMKGQQPMATQRLKIMGTGSRSMVIDPDRKEIYVNLENHILSIVEASDAEVFLISGMAEGWDEAIAQVGLRNGIAYGTIVPNVGYGAYYWGRHSQTGEDRMATFNKLLDGAEKNVFLDELHPNSMVMFNWEMAKEEGTIAGPNFKTPDGWVHANYYRNTVMVNACDRAVVFNPQSKGTRDAVGKLKAAGKPYEVYPFSGQMGLF